MRVALLAEALAKAKPYSAIFQERDGSTIWQSVAFEARPLLIASLYLQKPQKILLITSSHEKALQWQARLTLCGVSEKEIFQMPSSISSLFQDSNPELAALSDRLGSLQALVDNKPAIIITTTQAALERTLPKDVFQQKQLFIKQRQVITPEQLIKSLLEIGYERSEPVTMHGQFSHRGGIIDVYVMGQPAPYRVEFFGDEVESIREFDPTTQSSLRTLKKITVVPARETLFTTEDNLLESMIRQTLELESSELEPDHDQNLRELVESDIQQLNNQNYFNRIDLYRPLLHSDSPSPIDLLDEAGLLILDEPAELDAKASRAEEELSLALNSRSKRGEILKASYLDYMVSFDSCSYFPNIISLTTSDFIPSWLNASKKHILNIESLASYHGQAAAFQAALKNWKVNKLSIVLGTDQPARAKDVVAKADLFALPQNEPILDTPGLHLIQGNLAGGFIFSDIKCVVLSDQELFGVWRLKLPQKQFSEGAPITTLFDLKDGDFVVHIHYGIGIFRGMTSRNIDGVQKDYLYIEYAAPDKLFVPVDQLDRIQKYLNPTESAPQINRLTGSEWKKTISKAKEEAKKFAKDLIQLYAERVRATRPKYPTDSPWQRDMESTFPWVETPSQLQAIKDVKFDLTQDHPMDRLICGDVGFGKTEVAIRAAFKVAQAEKQVAFLCPTTILSEQHYKNFEERLNGFSIRVDLLNRFRTSTDKKAILDQLASGEIDIVLGTHALLNKSIKFKNLGLVIIDEEQKFGVKQKEALKALRANIDVLTLSATPIPRTLSMALMDIRQMSLINDPPPGRLPVRTDVRPYSRDIIIESILKELARGGQIFYLYNRVEGIHHIAAQLKKMVPTANIGVAHGQLKEAELEPIMIDFIKGKLDILVCTSIVESGLDIPNANTLIVENAHMFGLSQLYQLRGRVGRSDRQAYAYFLYPDMRELGENATARLTSLQQFSSLGSGYSLAYRDLQIRGAGDLLGASQHGTMSTVGYELYTQLIQEQIQILKAVADGKASTDDSSSIEHIEPLPTIDLPVSALIPQSYIEEQAQRLYFYKKMMSRSTRPQLTETFEEIKDRYGKPPLEVQNAFAIMRMRLQAQSYHIDKIESVSGNLIVTFINDSVITPIDFSSIKKLMPNCTYHSKKLRWPYHQDPLNACEQLLLILGKVFTANQ